MSAEGLPIWGEGSPQAPAGSSEELLRQLRERTKELECLHSLSRLIADSSLDLDRLFQHTCELIPASWQNPHQTSASIQFDGKIFQSGNFAVTATCLQAPLWVRGVLRGRVEVCVIVAADEPGAQAAFLPEERSLLQTIVTSLERAVLQVESERDLQYRQELARQIMLLSARFMAASPARLDGTIEDALSRIGELCRADRSYIFFFDDAMTTMDNTHEWCAAGISPERENLQSVPCSLFPAWISTLARRENILIPEVATLGPDWQAEREILEPQGVLSLAVVPLWGNHGLMGFLGFDSVRSLRQWQEDEVSLLRVLADLIASALDRSRSETFLRQVRSTTASNIITAIAHHWRQPLTALSLALQDMIDTQDYGEMDARYLRQGVGEALGKIEEMSEVIDRFDHFLRPRYDAGAFSPNTSIHELLKLVGSQFSAERIELEYDAEHPQALVRGYEYEFTQALLAILSNAREAIERYRARKPSAPVRILIESTTDAAFMRIRITNTGEPLAAHAMEQMFMPYISNHHMIPGRGLGLYFARIAIEENMGGTISVENTIGGVRVNISLPLCPEDGTT